LSPGIEIEKKNGLSFAVIINYDHYTIIIKQLQLGNPQANK
jgi:hypothetical protein